MIGKSDHYITQDLFIAYQRQLALEGLGDENASGVSGRTTVEVMSEGTFRTGTMQGGLQVTEDLSVSYQRKLEEQGANTVGVEYRLNPNTMVRGTSSDRGQTTLDFLWRIDY